MRFRSRSKYRIAIENWEEFLRWIRSKKRAAKFSPRIWDSFTTALQPRNLAAVRKCKSDICFWYCKPFNWIAFLLSRSVLQYLLLKILFPLFHPVPSISGIVHPQVIHLCRIESNYRWRCGLYDQERVGRKTNVGILPKLMDSLD